MWAGLASFLRTQPALRRSWHLLYWTPTLVVVGELFYRVRIVSGRSMQPTLNPDSSLQWRDVGVFDKYTVEVNRDYSRGDIVAVVSPENPKQLLIKRIVAMEGDIVQTRPPFPKAKIRVPEGHVWIEGDEGFHSGDSNHFGPVPTGLIDSRLVLLVWPPSRWRTSKALSDYPGRAAASRRVSIPHTANEGSSVSLAK